MARPTPRFSARAKHSRERRRLLVLCLGLWFFGCHAGCALAGPPVGPGGRVRVGGACGMCGAVQSRARSLLA